MGCFSSKFDEPSQPMHPHQQMAHQQSWGQPVHAIPVQATPAGGPEVQYGQQYDQQFQQPYPPTKLGPIPDTPFLQTAAPNGQPWGEYVRNGPLYVDDRSGDLVGPWAECIAWAVHFEHSEDWSNHPMYAGGEGPVGGLLSSLSIATDQRRDHEMIMVAANRLEEAAHAAARMGKPLPVIGTMVGGSPPRETYNKPYGEGYGSYQQGPAYGGQAYGQGQPYGQAQPYGQGQPYRQGQSYGQPQYGGYDQQQSYGASGPTLLGQRPNYGMGGPMGAPTQPNSSGGGGMGKMAMAAAGGAAAGAAGMYAMGHMDDIGDAMEDIGEGVADFGGDAVDFVEDIF